MRRASEEFENGHQKAKGEIEISSLIELLEDQDETMRSLLAKALNLYVSPGADAIPENEKLDRLQRAIQESLE